VELITEENSISCPIQVIPQQRVVSDNSKNFCKLGNADMILGQLPGLVTTWTGVDKLNNAYKIVMPEGVTGELVRNSKLNDLLTTTVRGSNGQFKATAGLESLAGSLTPAAVASTAFSVASVVVGQYFLCQINKSLTKISENIERLEKQIDTVQESNVFSGWIFLKEIQNDWSLILESSDFRLTTTSSILQTVNNLTSSIYYFENRLNVKLNDLSNLLEKDKIADQVLINDISRTTEFLKLAYETRSCLKLILIYLTTGITKNNFEEIKRTLNRDETLLFSTTVKQLDKQIDYIIDTLKKAPTIKLQKQAHDIKSQILNIQEITRDRYKDSINNNIETTISKLKQLDEEGCVFYVEDNTLYIENKVVA
jgi:hypothetical protein